MTARKNATDELPEISLTPGDVQDSEAETSEAEAETNDSDSDSESSDSDDSDDSEPVDSDDAVTHSAPKSVYAQHIENISKG